MAQDNFDDEAEAFDPRHLFMEEVERRQQIARATTAGAEVMFDLSQKGPLYRYLVERRTQAAKALERLVEADPKDAVEVATAQLEVREYANVFGWVRGTIADAATADMLIKEEFPSDGEAPPPAQD